MNLRRTCILFVVSLILNLTGFVTPVAANLLGKKCPSIGAMQVANGKLFTCVKKKKKKVWNSGSEIIPTEIVNLRSDSKGEISYNFLATRQDSCTVTLTYGGQVLETVTFEKSNGLIRNSFFETRLKAGIARIYVRCIHSGTATESIRIEGYIEPSPSNSPAPTISPKPTGTKSSAPQVYKAENSDLQFIYGTTESCGSHIGFMRIAGDGTLKINKTIVKGDSKYRVTPLDYNSDELLFKTEFCKAGNTDGQVVTLWRLNLGNPSSRPQEIYSLSVKGTRDGILIDAKIDIASGKTIVFAWIGGDQQIFTAESNPLLIWSLQRQGWLNAGLYATAFDVSTGWSLSVYGYNSTNSTWRSAYVDWRTEIPGLGKVTPRGFGSNAQFQGRGSVSSIRTGILKMPYVFETSQGIYICVDFPTSSGAVVETDTDSRCNRISGKQMGDIATSFAKGNDSGSWQAVISPSDKKAYVFKSGPIFGTWQPVQIQKSIDITGALSSQQNIFEMISTYEISWDLGEVSPSLTYSGFFSNP